MPAQQAKIAKVFLIKKMKKKKKRLPRFCFCSMLQVKTQSEHKEQPVIHYIMQPGASCARSVLCCH